MKHRRCDNWLGVTVLAGALALQVSVAAAADFAGENNYQVGCFTLAPAGNQRLSPGMNNGHEEGDFAFCQIVLDGNALSVADLEILNDGEYVIDLVVPTFTTFPKEVANGIVNVAVVGDYGAGPGSFWDVDGEAFGDGDIPAGHPLIGNPHVLGAFANGDLANDGDVTIPEDGSPPPFDTFSTGPSLFSNQVTGIKIPVRLNGFGVPAVDIERIDIFFAIQFAVPDLRKCRSEAGTGDGSGPGTGGGGGGQDFPCKETLKHGKSVNGAASWFSGPGPLWIGYKPQFSTGIATVPFKITGSEAPKIEMSSVGGVKFCDLDVNGDCDSGTDPLVNGTEITVWVCGLDGDDTDCDSPPEDPDEIVAVFTTGATGVEGDPGQPYSQAVLTINKKGQGYETTLDILPEAVIGGYLLTIARECGDGLEPLEIQIAEAVDGIFDQQTSPVGGDQVEDFIAVDSGGDLNVYWAGNLDCDETNDGLDFGNIKFDLSDGDPHTIGFWGAALITSAINTYEEENTLENMCGPTDEAPGNSTLPHPAGMGYDTPALVAELIDGAAANCQAFDATINAVTETDDLLCTGANHLPPYFFDQDLGQLLGALLNYQSGLIEEGSYVDLECLGFEGDPILVSDILAAACTLPDGPSDYHDILGALNELDPLEDPEICLFAPTCELGDKVTGDFCS